MEEQDLGLISIIFYLIALLIALLIGITAATLTALAVIHMIGGY